MSRIVKIALALSCCSLVVAAPSLWAYWNQDGVPLCTDAASQQVPGIVSDEAGGAIVAWQDYRTATGDIYAQRVDAYGAVQWIADGVNLCNVGFEQLHFKMIPDGAGGAIVAWQDNRAQFQYDIYAQRVSASGAVQWAAGGAAFCRDSRDQYYPAVASDGAGGAIVAWEDWRNGNGAIYAQRVDASGAIQWTSDGIAVCATGEGQAAPVIVSDGAGGAIVAWRDSRSEASGIYTQRLNALGSAMWSSDGVPLCTASGGQSDQEIISDGAGGAIVTWDDWRSGAGYDVYAQRVDASGAVQWIADGVAVCTATGPYEPSIAPDGEGGAIVTWYDWRNEIDTDIYAQRVSASGAVQWALNGVAICTTMGNQELPAITSDGAGGAIVTWQDARSGYCDIYAQRVDASGGIQWTLDGVALSTATSNQLNPVITSGGAGEAIVAWQDARSGNYDIYAQFIDSSGRVSVFAPDILSVRDVPGDQGGWVRITVERSEVDDALVSDAPASLYNVWQRIDDPAMVAVIAAAEGDAVGSMTGVPLKQSMAALGVSIWPVREWNGRCFVCSREVLGEGALPAGTWELIGSFAACQQEEYIYRASTLADSTASGTPYSVYIVSVHTTDPLEWEVSDPDSGYSVDNLPPEPPGGLVAEQSFVPEGLALDWDLNAANDLSHYAVYRGTSEDFVPAVGNRIAAPVAPEFFDSTWRWDGGFYYKISALDVHGNESGFGLLRPEDVTGAGTLKAPEAAYLKQNYPNPFNPVTKIEFGLAAPGRVILRIYDAAGRFVRELVDEARPATRYEETWDGRDGTGRQLASGVYFYRLDAGSFMQTRKMILLR